MRGGVRASICAEVIEMPPEEPTWQIEVMRLLGSAIVAIAHHKYREAIANIDEVKDVYLSYMVDLCGRDQYGTCDNTD